MFSAMPKVALAASARLFAEIERSGSGSAAFWSLYWDLLLQLTEEEVRRVLTAAGHRSLRTQLGTSLPGAGTSGGSLVARS